MKETKNTIAFYARNEKGGVDELILDLFEKEYEYNAGVDERELFKRRGGGHPELEIELADLQKLFSIVDSVFQQGTFRVQRKSYDVRQEEKRQREPQQDIRELVPKERVWQAIAWECGKDELNELCSYDKYRFEKDVYYNFALIMDKFHAFMEGERTVGYFCSWLILLTRCLLEAMPCQSSRRQEIYSEIADIFDGASFMSSDISDEEKRVDCLETIALLKDLDHRLRNADTGKNEVFTKNGVATYVTFVAFVNGSELHKLCVADEDRATVNYLFVSDPVFREDINYTFLTNAEFDELFGAYFDYSLDPAMQEDYALTKVAC